MSTDRVNKPKTIKIDPIELDRIIEEECAELLSQANTTGLTPVTWACRVTPYGIAFDGKDPDGEVVMVHAYPDPAADATPGGIAIAWPRAVPALRTALYGVILLEICVAAFLGAYFM